MLKVFDLVKIYIKEMFGNGKKKNGNNTTVILFVVLAIILYGWIFYSVFNETINFVLLTSDSVNDCLYPLIGMSIISSVMFAYLAGNKLSLTKKDIVVLVPYPIEEKLIIRSKFIFAFIVESFFNVFIGIVYLISYILTAEYNLIGILTIISLSLFINIIPLITISIIVLLIHNAISKSKNSHNLAKIERIITILLVAALSFTLTITFSSNGTFNLVPIYRVVATYYPLTYLLRLGIETNNILYPILFGISNVLILVLFYAIFSKKIYKLMINDPNYDKDNSIKKVLYKEESVSKSLLKKEFKLMISNTIYSMNFLTSCIMISICSVVELVTISKEIGVSYVMPSLLFLTGLGISATYSPCFTPSIDYKYDWILKVLPIKEKQIFNTKIKFNMIFQCGSSLFVAIAYMIYSIIIYNNFVDVIGYILFMFTLSYAVSSLQLIIGLKYPDTTNDINHIVKQSKAAGLGLLFSFLVSLVPIVLYIYLTTLIPSIFSFLVASILNVGLCFLFKALIDKKGIQYYNNFY